MVSKQLIKEVIKEMIRDGDIRIVVESGSDVYNYYIEVSTVPEVEGVVLGMSIELEIEDE